MAIHCPQEECRLELLRNRTQAKIFKLVEMLKSCRCVKLVCVVVQNRITSLQLSSKIEMCFCIIPTLQFYFVTLTCWREPKNLGLCHQIYFLVRGWVLPCFTQGCNLVSQLKIIHQNRKYRLFTYIEAIPQALQLAKYNHPEKLLYQYLKNVTQPKECK